MKILIAADMEGITGVTTWDQVDPRHAEYARFHRLAAFSPPNACLHPPLKSGRRSP